MDWLSGDFSFWLIGGLGAGLLISLVLLLAGPKLGKILGLLSLIGVLGVIGMGVSLPQVVTLLANPVRTGTQAQGDHSPLQVNFSNLRPSEFTTSWDTQTAVVGAIRYGNSPDNINSAAAGFDPSTKKTHHVVRVTGLKPGTYYLEIISGGQTYKNNDQPWTVILPSVP